MLIRIRIVAFSIMIVVAAAMAGCLGSRTSSAAGPIAPAVFLDYHRTGGIAGFDDRLIIFDNGAAIVATRTTSREFEVNKTEIARIRSLFDKAGFESLEGNYTSHHGGADFFRYSITYHNMTVLTEDTAIPPALEPIIPELNQIVSANQISTLKTGSLPEMRG